MSLEIAIETPLQDEVRTLVAELNAVLLDLTPPEYCHHLTVEQMADEDTTVFIAREGGVAIACGALRRHADGIGEQIVARIEAMARAEGLKRLVLETGDRHHAAWKVYERSGFGRCGPVLDYPDVKWSVFYDKALAD
jgi:putative acetyltransferase